MIKKIRLKNWVKNVLTILSVALISSILALIFIKSINDIDKLAKQCDADRGYTCSYYEVRQYSLGK